MNKLALALSLALCACTAQRRNFAPPDPDLPFSSGVLVGDTYYVAGHLGRDPQTGSIPEDPAAEAGFLLDAFAASLARAGMTMDDLVQVQVFCADVSLYDTFNGIYRQRFSSEFPARAFVGSGQLLRGARFEMLGTAVRQR